VISVGVGVVTDEYGWRSCRCILVTNRLSDVY
jgi:hypothetical protein